MTQRTMKCSYALSLLACFAALLGSRAQAQTATSAYANITEVRIDGEKKEVATPVYINAQECESEFVFKLANIATTVPVMEAWVANDETTDCFQATNRSFSATSTPSCWLAGSQSGVTGEFKFALPGSAIFNRKDPTTCPSEAINWKFRVQFVPLASSSENTGTSAPAPILTVLRASATFTLYTQRPKAPSNIKVRNGGRELRVSWDRVDTMPLTRYRAFFDYGTGGTVNPLCGSDALEFSNSSCGAMSDAGVTQLDAGVTLADGGTDTEDDDTTTTATGNVCPPREGKPFVEYVTTKGESASLTKLDNIPYGTNVAVAVSVIDATGNVGYLSERQCVQRIQTTDLIDACNTSEDCELESCSLSPKSTGSAVTLSMLALALNALIRRRRSA